MGNSSSNSKSKATQLVHNIVCEICHHEYDSGKDSWLWQLPKESQISSMQVVFVPGSLKNRRSATNESTWQTADGSRLWPETWLKEDFCDAHVIFCRYSPEFYRDINMSLEKTGERLLDDLMDNKIGQLANCPLILVGHCFGGLVIKHVCAIAERRRLRFRDEKANQYVNFLNNVRGVFFYATPHGGVSVNLPNLSWTQLDFWVYGWARRAMSDYSSSQFPRCGLEVHSKETSDLNSKFRKLAQDFKWRLDALGETKRIYVGTIWDIIVPEASAGLDCENFKTVEGADHWTVCCPESKSSIRYDHLKTFINRSIKDMQNKTWKQVGELSVNESEEAVLGWGSKGTCVFEGLLARVDAGQQHKVMEKPIEIAVKRLLSIHYKAAQKEIDVLLKISTTKRQHPNVVRYYRKEENHSFIYLGLERCSFSLGDLICAHTYRGAITKEKLKYLARKGLKFENEEDWKLWDENKEPSLKLFEIMSDTVSGLIHLHHLGITHRDLKPNNILICIDGTKMHAKIADMGISKFWGDGAESSEQTATTSSNSGTRGWQAPEKMERGKKLDKAEFLAADIFSLGCMLYYCITGGEHPFGAESQWEVNIKSGERKLFDNETMAFPEARDLIESMLDGQSVKRPLAQSILNHPFFWNVEKCMLFLGDVSDRLDVDRKNKTNPTFLADVENRQSDIQCRGWDSKIDPLLLQIVKNRPAYQYHLVRDLLRIIRNKAHHFGPDSEAILKSKPEGLVKYFKSRFPRLLIEIYQVVEVHCEGDPSFEPFKKYYSVDT